MLRSGMTHNLAVSRPATKWAENLCGSVCWGFCGSRRSDVWRPAAIVERRQTIPEQRHAVKTIFLVSQYFFLERFYQTNQCFRLKACRQGENRREKKTMPDRELKATREPFPPSSQLRSDELGATSHWSFHSHDASGDGASPTGRLMTVREPFILVAPETIRASIEMQAPRGMRAAAERA